MTRRTVAVWLPDWPLAGIEEEPAANAPLAVLVAEQVLACSGAARAEGVTPGIRRREAQRRCPDIALFARNEDAEMRAFEPLLTALEGICPEVEVVRPGLCLFGAKGPARYFGGDTALARAALETCRSVHCTARIGFGEVRIGIADGAFAATLAARNTADPGSSTIVAHGGTAAFLAPFPVRVLGHPELTDLFIRLGLHTLGQLAALPARHVASRFGPPGALVHRLAGGRDGHRSQPRAQSPQISLEQELEPPEEGIEPLAFVAKMLADRLYAELTQRGLGCTRLLVEAETEHGEIRSRMWRHEQSLTAPAISQRVRWQLEGWLTGPADHRPSGGISLLRLVPEGIHREEGEQLRLFGGPTDTDEKAAAAVRRLQGLLGFDAVHVPVEGGGRHPAGYVRLARWGEAEPAAERPWPGRLPAPYPSVLFPAPLPARVSDSAGVPVLLDDRGVLSAVPQTLSVRDGRPIRITEWAGPWPVHERWWDRDAPGSCARVQVVVAGGSARLLSLRGTQWWLEGEYE